jgi:hypothetical protein
LFSEYLVQLDLGKAGKIALSPLRINDQDPMVSQPYRKISLLVPGKSVKTEGPDREGNQLSLNGKFTLENNGKTTGQFSASWSGIVQPYLRIKKNERAVTGLFTDGIGIKDIREFAVKENKPLSLKVNYTIDKNDALHESSSLLYMAIPQLLGDAGNWGFSELPSTRTEILELPAEIDQDYNLTLALSANYTLLTPEMKKNQKNSAGNVEISLKKEGQTVVIVRKLSLDAFLLKPEQVSDLKALMNIWLNKNYKQLIFKKN